VLLSFRAFESFRFKEASVSGIGIQIYRIHIMCVRVGKSSAECGLSVYSNLIFSNILNTYKSFKFLLSSIIQQFYIFE
jgi:hypothetical protein